MKARRGVAGLAAFAGGVLAGMALEEIVYRRAFTGSDAESSEPLGTLRGSPIEVRARDGARLHAEAFGPADGPGLVLCHGFTLALDVWHYQIKALASEGRWRVVAYDARGHGRSDPVGAGGLSPEVLASDLASVLEQSRVEPCVVVGHSMGGITLQALARYGTRFAYEAGGRVRGLVLANTTFTAALGAWKDGSVRHPHLRERLLTVGDLIAADPGRFERIRFRATDLAMFLTRVGFGTAPSPSHVAFARRMIERTPNATFAGGVGGLAHVDLHEGLGALDVPVLIIAGGRDVITPSWLSVEMAARIPDAELLTFDGAGHMSMLECHEAFNRALRVFCERVL